jgi:hypothetical protein
MSSPASNSAIENDDINVLQIDVQYIAGLVGGSIAINYSYADNEGMLTPTPFVFDLLGSAGAVIDLARALRAHLWTRCVYMSSTGLAVLRSTSESVLAQVLQEVRVALQLV